jgi:hypothetical protein
MNGFKNCNFLLFKIKFLTDFKGKFLIGFEFLLQPTLFGQKILFIEWYLSS